MWFAVTAFCAQFLPQSTNTCKMSESFLQCSNYGIENTIDGNYYPVSTQQQIYDDRISIMGSDQMRAALHIQDRYTGVDIYNNQEVDLNEAFSAEYSVSDNTLAYIDDLLNMDLITFDISDSGCYNNNSSRFKTFPHGTALPPSRFDNLDGTLDVRDTTGASENHATLPKQDEIDKKNSVVSDSINGELEWHVSYDQWSSHPVLLQQRGHRCDQCKVLHQMIHTNVQWELNVNQLWKSAFSKLGERNQGTKLEIHGSEDEIYHAVIQTRFLRNDGFPASVQQQMVEFPVGNSEYVKQFLLQYSLLCKKEGFTLLQDSRLPDGNRTYCKSSAKHFAAPLGARHINESIHGCHSADLAHETTANEKIYSVSGAEFSGFSTKPIRNNTAAQREKTGKLKMSDLAKHFHLPINVAAKELGICPTVLKKICRRNGMRRWPHRKIKSIERIIATLEQTIADGSGQGDEDIRKEIALLRNERSQLCAGLMGQL